jgi:hypothetical protein
MEAAPDKKVWNGIRSHLWFANLQNTFNGFAVSPGASVWRGISFRLWLKSFFTFQASTFNIYYATGGAASILVAIWFMLPAVHSSPAMAHDIFNPDRQVISSLNTSSDEITANTVNTNNYTAPIQQNNQNVTTQNVNNQNTLAQNNTVQNTITHQTLNTDNHVPKNPVIDNPEHDIIQPEQSSVIRYDQLKHINKLNPGPLANLNDESPFIPRENGKQRFMERAASVFFSPLFCTSKFEIPESESNAGYLANTSGMGWTTGLSLSWSWFSYTAEAGLAYTKLSSSHNCQFVNFTYDTVMVSEIIHGGYYDTDTFYVINLDTLLATGDTVYIEIVDVEFIPTTDTIQREQVNANQYTESKKQKVTYSYVEFPITFGYKIIPGRFSVTAKAGIVPGLLIASKGDIPNPYSDVGQYPVMPVTGARSFVLSGLVGLEMNYSVTEKLSIVLEPNYKHHIFSVLNPDLGASHKFRAAGILRTAIRYRF